MTNLFTDWIANPYVQDFYNHLIAGEIGWLTGLFWLAVATAFSMIGGAIGGMLLAGKDLGYQLAAMIGGLFGPLGVIPSVAIGLVVLKFV